MISQNLIQSIGWTLIHSIWQGLAIFVVLKITVRAVRNSNIKYFMGVAAMALLVIASVITFFILNAESATSEFRITLDAVHASPSVAQVSSVLDFINNNIIWFIRFWAIGFAVGLLRIAAGLYYINRLRRNAYPVQEEWMQMVNNLSESLNVNRIVAMAEASISSPMVVGFMKPVILFPIGLLSGLTTEQVETILVHELSHIRRQDYIINLIQSVVETIFFFNPFALLMSSMIREERENCCDDMVIAKGISPISYVKTLAQLEAARNSSSLALGFTGNQNQLLNRIKRIMENSAKNDWGKSRFVPVALLFLGLVCASWLSINSEKEVDLQQEPKQQVSMKLANGFVITADTIIEMPLPPGPPVKEMVIEIPEVIELPDVLEIPEMAGITEFDFFGPDSVPAYHFKMREPMDFSDPAQFEQFEREFTQKFKTQFKDFYEKNEFQFQKMFEEAKREQWERREALEVVDLDNVHRFEAIGDHKAELDKVMAELSQIQSFKAMEMSQDQLRQAEVMMKMSEDQMAIANKQYAESHRIYEDMARKSEDYKRELIEMLREDGYITKHDDLDHFQFNNDNGVMTVNGKKIKEKDVVKYQALSDKYFANHKKRYDTGRNE